MNPSESVGSFSDLVDDDKPQCEIGIQFGSDEEDEFCISNGVVEDAQFDKIVGALEDMLVDPDFTASHNSFLRENCEVFEDSEENKLSYTKIFKEYQDLIEGLVEGRLVLLFSDFDMKSFLSVLEERHEEVVSDVFDIFAQFADFESFKQLMIDTKKMHSFASSSSSSVTMLTSSTTSSILTETPPISPNGLNDSIDELISIKACPIHRDEMPDGVEMPDLNLQISALAIDNNIQNNKNNINRVSARGNPSLAHSTLGNNNNNNGNNGGSGGHSGGSHTATGAAGGAGAKKTPWR
eukprot:comp19879_c0_seq1/m.38591 comp19879_c0_seq1/g.38591  ORF comp19879_c0_seq1/g.38591 comp19879_c0_seq1/m.38591 type:complete len:295 (-) comp19879_c0_seq1:203-1087(-)